MTKSKAQQARRAAPYLRRAVEDDYVQQQLRNAAERLRDVYGRASRRQGAAAEDKKLYRDLREAAISIRKTIGRIEQPPRKKHGLRNSLLAGATIGGALLLTRRKGQDDAEVPGAAPGSWTSGPSEDQSAQTTAAHSAA